MKTKPCEMLDEPGYGSGELCGRDARILVNDLPCCSFCLADLNDGDPDAIVTLAIIGDQSEETGTWRRTAERLEGEKSQAEARVRELESALESTEAELDSATTRGRELVQQAETYAQIAETRVAALEAKVRELEAERDSPMWVHYSYFDDAWPACKPGGVLKKHDYRVSFKSDEVTCPNCRRWVLADQLRAEVARLTPLVADANWVRVTERLPKLNEHVIARDKFYGIVGEAFMWREGSWMFVGAGKDDCSITHWRPMPAPPAEET